MTVAHRSSPTIRPLATLLGVAALTLGCGAHPPGTGAARTPSTTVPPTPAPSATASATVSPSDSATARPTASSTTTSPALQTYGGADVRWPHVPTDVPSGPALGAVVTQARITLADGRTLAPDLVLPVEGGTRAHPRVLTPCGRSVVVADGGLLHVPPSTPGHPVVVVDPGHGGHNDGTSAPDGTREADRVLQIALVLRDDLERSGITTILTRDRDMDASLGYRRALADALAARIALSVHLNAAPETASAHPGLSTYGSVSQPDGRRAAGVVYQAERRYLQTLTPRVGRWAANRDAGALYRLSTNGGDYYAVMRDAHVPWVISESLYLSQPREAALVADPAVRAGLAAAMAAGVTAYLQTSDPGSGWRVPIRRPPDAPKPPGTYTCVDPS